MNKPEGMIVEEATREIETAINEISKKHKLSYFNLKVILNSFYEAILNEEKKQREQYIAFLEKEKKNKKKEE